MNPETLTIITGTSSVLGFLSLLAYLYYTLQVKEIERSERSVREIVEGEGLFNAEQVLLLLREFKDDEKRLDALRALTDLSSESAKRIYSKITGSIDVAQISTKPSQTMQFAPLAAGVFFLFLALAAFLYSRYKAPAPTPDQMSSAFALMDIQSQQEGKSTEDGGLHWVKPTIFRVYNRSKVNLRDVNIEVIPDGIDTRSDENSLFAHTAQCVSVSPLTYVWQIRCDYIGRSRYRVCHN